MKRKFLFFLFMLLAAILAACSTGQTPTATIPENSRDETNAAASSGQSTAPGLEQDLARTDSQGSVEFVVEPLNLTSPGETVEFEVTMDTHSVDLSWDMAAQSVLATDTGLEVQGLSWPGGSGHHVEGKLTFPAMTAGGQPLLDGAKTLTLTIRDAGAAERVFTWELSQ